MEWILSNKEWFLSGIGIAIPLAFITLFFQKKNQAKQIQNQRSGNNSSNLQAGRDITTNKKNSKK